VCFTVLKFSDESCSYSHYSWNELLVDCYILIASLQALTTTLTEESRLLKINEWIRYFENQLLCCILLLLRCLVSEWFL